jgi:protein-S-isoprenylcysteine O-methyltransferase Ste14
MSGLFEAITTLVAHLFDPAVHRALVIALFALAPLTVLALRFVVAPYGRHARRGFGPTLPDRLGWFLMESPALFGFAFVYSQGRMRMNPGSLALLCLWLLHYGQRTLIYPLRLRSRGKRMPLLIAGSAICFNLLNLSVNAPAISGSASFDSSWLRDPRFLLGAALFLAGFAANLDADRRLFALRPPGETGYRIPHGGLFEYVSCPNYLAEIVEWTGWAIATWSWAGTAFALYTAANLAPRAAANHAWYRARFSDYPPARRALVPFLW